MRMSLGAPVFAGILLTVCSAGATPAHRGDAELDAKLATVERTVDARRQALHIPGVALVIVRDDKIIDNRGLGLRDIEHQLPVTPKTLFAIGSSTKAFTAMTVMMTRDEGKLQLTDSPKKFLPYFRLKDPDADAHITITDLLSHQSGLARTDMIWSSGRLSSTELIRALAFVQPTAKLHERFQYQNLMFLAAGQIVGEVHHTRWTDFVAKRIFRPLGMLDTDTDVKVMQRSPDYALGYTWDEGEKRDKHLPMRSLPQIAPAGAINSNTTDMAQWLRFLLNGGVANGKRLVSEAAFKEMFVKRITITGDVGYGFGWMLHDWHGHFVAEHGGNIDGFNAQVAIMPDQHLGFVLLTNVSASPLGAETMEVVWSSLVGVPPSPHGLLSEERERRRTDAESASVAPTAQPTELVGAYATDKAPIKLNIAARDGKVSLIVPGQPAYPLVATGKDAYSLGSLPKPFGLKVRRDAAGRVTGVLITQPPAQGDMELVRETDAFRANLTVDALMQKVIDAAGGEANLRKHTSTIEEATLTADTQGITAKERNVGRAPNLHESEITFIAVKKRIGYVRSYCDGKRAGEESNLTPATVKSGNELMEVEAQSAFYPELDWKRLYKSVKIVRMGKVGDEEVYVVEKTPVVGGAVTDFISTKTFRVLKEEAITTTAGGAQLPTSTTFSDFRTVDGVVTAFHRSEVIPGVGLGDVTVNRIRFNVRIPDKEFAPREPTTPVPSGSVPAPARLPSRKRASSICSVPSHSPRLYQIANRPTSFDSPYEPVCEGARRRERVRSCVN